MRRASARDKSTAGKFNRQIPITNKRRARIPTSGLAHRTQACAPSGRARAERESMSRELIVSVNGREKKIAIVENDRVTEFYIERGEQNQGIVGNLYKGRVMRVLPGMQSAFVDIGLERDAFLYVSDFFDEEAEFERIGVDGKKGDAAAEKAAVEKIEQARIEREHHIESTHERVNPLLEAEGAAAEPVEPEEAEETGTRRRGRRGGRGRKRGAKTEVEPAREERSLIPHEVGPFDTPFVSAASFERVSDDESILNGEILKDARLQERIMDEVHAVEFDLEDVPSAPVGSLLSGEFRESGEFQRVADSEDLEVAPARPRAIEEAHVRDFVDEIVDESSRGSAFERVSDDENASVDLEGATEIPAPPSRSRKKSGVISRFFKSKKSEGEDEADAATESRVSTGDEVNADAEAGITSGRTHEEFATRRGGRRRRRTKPAGAAGESDGANGQDESAEPLETEEALLTAATDEGHTSEKPDSEVTEEDPGEAGAPRTGRRPAPRGRRRQPRHERKQVAISELLSEGQE